MPNTYAATNQKKFLDAEGLTYFSRKLNNYPTNDVIEAVIEGVQDALDEKVDNTSVGTANGVASLDSTGKVPSSQLPPETTYEFDSNYNPPTNKIATMQSIANAFSSKNGDITGTPGVGKTLTSFSQSGANVTAVFNDIRITKSQVSDFPLEATESATGLMSAADKIKLDGIAEGATNNTGTITGIIMNDQTVGTSGIVNLGTVITQHQDISGKLNTNLKGANNGLAELDENGKVPSSQLPSYVDDVLEFSTRDGFPLTGETDKIYVNLADNKTYRWSGSIYVEISQSLALGTTEHTAFRGDYGDIAYSHALAKGTAYNQGLYKITTNAEGHITNALLATKEDITDLGIPGQDTTYSAITNAQIDSLFE